jgi:tetratricopeptide (TPR) repeat protein
MSDAVVRLTIPATMNERRTESIGPKRRWRLVLTLVVVAGVLFCAGWKWWEARRTRRAIARIDEEMEQGLHALAARNLVALLAWNPGSDEAAYRLGACEQARGRPQAAAEAWSRVAPDSPLWPQAIEGRMELEIQSGRLAGAEQLIKSVLDDPRTDGSDASILLGPIFCQQGRVEEAKPLIEARWEHLDKNGDGASEKAINLVRLYIELQRTLPPVDAVRVFLDKAGLSNPDDDRIWLGRANLAIRIGSYDEAAQLLAACIQRRPDDPAVWQARLSWAIATGKVDEAREALEHLPVRDSAPAQIENLVAWFARRRGDIESERRALERRIAVDPADSTAWDRLIELAEQKGQPDRAVRLRRQQREVEAVMSRYYELHDRYQPARDAAEMAHLAERLGRSFEAKVFLTVATKVDPHRDDLARDLSRLKQNRDTSRRMQGTLAAAIASRLDAQREPRP